MLRFDINYIFCCLLFSDNIYADGVKAYYFSFTQKCFGKIDQTIILGWIFAKTNLKIGKKRVVRNNRFSIYIVVDKHDRVWHISCICIYLNLLRFMRKMCCFFWFILADFWILFPKFCPKIEFLHFWPKIVYINVSKFNMLVFHSPINII